MYKQSQGTLSSSAHCPARRLVGSRKWIDQTVIPHFGDIFNYSIHTFVFEF
jgi:hypothetical protein